MNKNKTIMNKIPTWVKSMFGSLFLTVIILNLLGLNIVSFLNNAYYLKIYLLIVVGLANLYQLFEIYMLYLFIKKNIQISEVLPDFIIDQLKQLEMISQEKESVKSFKEGCYIQLSIYITVLMIVAIFY